MCSLVRKEIYEFTEFKYISPTHPNLPSSLITDSTNKVLRCIQQLHNLTLKEEKIKF